MHLVTQSALLEALGWSLFNSLWQMGLLWGLFNLLTLVFKRGSARWQHGLALLLLGGGTIWSILSFIIAYNQPAAGLGENNFFLVSCFIFPFHPLLKPISLFQKAEIYWAVRYPARTTGICERDRPSYGDP